MVFNQNDQKSCIKCTKCVELGIKIKEISSILRKKHNLARLGGFRYALYYQKRILFLCCLKAATGVKGLKHVRDNFKTQQPVDRRFRPVLAGFYSSKQ